MKRDFHITDTKHGRRLMMLAPEKTQALVEAGQAAHVRGNMYRTKVMVADVNAVQVVSIDEAEPQPLNGEPKPDAFKRKRGRPAGKKK